MDEKKPVSAQELTDAQLDTVNGGGLSVQKDGHLYVFIGKQEDIGRAFICPKCLSGLRYTKSGTIEIFRCDRCGMGYFASKANPNFGSGLWMKLY